MLKSVHLFFILMLPLVLCADAPDFLNREAIAVWWNQFKNDPNNKWKTLSQNCSTTVAEALKAGNASTPWWDFWSSWNIVWTPADVEELARAINKKLE